MYEDSPEWRLVFGVYRRLYGTHPVREDIAGTVQSIARLTPRLLYSCTDAFYSPGQLVLAVAGNVTLAQVVAAAEKALRTGNQGDGKIFLYNVENVVKVRTGETDYDALQDDN